MPDPENLKEGYKGFNYHATNWGYKIFKDLELIHELKEDKLVDTRTNEQRAKMWIDCKLEYDTRKFGHNSG